MRRMQCARLVPSGAMCFGVSSVAVARDDGAPPDEGSKQFCEEFDCAAVGLCNGPAGSYECADTGF